jgi:UTP-glucose-1-phosphate uridylyltransferase
MATIKLLVPAAGFGTRAGHHLSKEMLTSPTGKRFIDGPLDCGRRQDVPVHVITRSEKTNLIQYLNQISMTTSAKNSGFHVEVQEIPATPDWPQTLLASKPFWGDWNLVYLPDVQWSPLDRMDQIIDWIRMKNEGDQQVICARFPTDQKNLFGTIEDTSFSEAEPSLRLCEKPQDDEDRTGFAWGIFGFQKQVGEDLLKAMAESTVDHQWKNLPLKIRFFELHSFEDLTRTQRPKEEES